MPVPWKYVALIRTKKTHDVGQYHETLHNRQTEQTFADILFLLTVVAAISGAHLG